MRRRRWWVGGGLVAALGLLGAWVWSRPAIEGPARSLVDIHGRVVALSGGEAIPGAYVIVNLRGATVDRRGRAGPYGCFAESGVAKVDADGNWRYQVEIVDAEATQILLDPTLRVYAPGWVRAQELGPPYKTTPIQASFDTENRIALVTSDDALDARLGHLQTLNADNCDFSPAHLAPNGWVALHLAINAEVWRNWCTANGPWHENRSAHEFGRIARLLRRPQYIEIAALQRWSRAENVDRARKALYQITELVPTYAIGDLDSRPEYPEAAARWDSTVGAKPPVTPVQQAVVCARFDPETFVLTEEQP
jgi:hypothetical protein